MNDKPRFPAAWLLALLNFALPVAVLWGGAHYGPGLVGVILEQKERRSWRVEVGALRFEAAPPWHGLSGKELNSVRRALTTQARQYAARYGIENAYPHHVQAFRHGESGPLLVVYVNVIPNERDYLARQKTEVARRLQWGSEQEGFEALRNEVTEINDVPCLHVEFRRGDTKGRLYTFVSAPREAVILSYVAERPSPEGEQALQRLLDSIAVD